MRLPAIGLVAVLLALLWGSASSQEPDPTVDAPVTLEITALCIIETLVFFDEMSENFRLVHHGCDEEGQQLTWEATIRGDRPVYALDWPVAK